MGWYGNMSGLGTIPLSPAWFEEEGHTTPRSSGEPMSDVEKVLLFIVLPTIFFLKLPARYRK
tara:strand:+ start:559 stop:744 length:186 start_codon:yes stop_codon:yes gene_type:complete